MPADLAGIPPVAEADEPAEEEVRIMNKLLQYR